MQTELKKDDVKNTVRILMQLDEKSLLLIDSGARMLLARQELEESKKKSVIKTKIKER